MVPDIQLEPLLQQVNEALDRLVRLELNVAELKGEIAALSSVPHDQATVLQEEIYDLGKALELVKANIAQHEEETAHHTGFWGDLDDSYSDMTCSSRSGFNWERAEQANQWRSWWQRRLQFLVSWGEALGVSAQGLQQALGFSSRVCIDDGGSPQERLECMEKALADQDSALAVQLLFFLLLAAFSLMSFSFLSCLICFGLCCRCRISCSPRS